MAAFHHLSSFYLSFQGQENASQTLMSFNFIGFIPSVIHFLKQFISIAISNTKIKLNIDSPAESLQCRSMD